MKRYRKQMIAAGILLAVILTGNLLARKTDWFGEWYAVTVYPWFVESAARISNLIPTSLIELALYGGVLLLVFLLVRSVVRLVKRKTSIGRALANGAWGLLLAALSLLAVETLTCGINYYRDEFSKVSGLTVEESTAEDLEGLCRRLLAEVNEAAADLQRDAKGFCVLDFDAEQEAREAMKKLGEQFPALDGYYPRPKKILTSAALSYQKLAGVYSAFTIEANYNRDMPDYEKPSTMCHELSHLRGFMREDEANYIAYLACMGSENAAFRYSGSMMAFVYATNALYPENEEAYWEIRESLREEVKAEWGAAGKWWAQFDGPVAEAYDKGADTFLKANGQTDGTKSYGRMVDLLLADYRKQQRQAE